MIPIERLTEYRDQLDRMVIDIESTSKYQGRWISKDMLGAVHNLLDAIYFIQAEIKSRGEPDSDVD